MKPTVQTAFPSFSTRFEGRLKFMYLDRKKLATTGIGNLIDPKEFALPLSWLVGGDPTQPATQDQISVEWDFVKSDPDGRSQQGGGAFESITTLRLTDADVDALVASKAAGNEASLKQRDPFSDFDDWPADAQLGLLSMAWAMGPAFHFPKFEAACGKLDDNGNPAPDFRAAADECHISEDGNPGVAPRNVADRQLFLNAADAVDGVLDPDEVHLP
jgi:hypothetical protein